MDENQKELHKLLLELSKENRKIDAANIEKYITKLKSIYQEKFRHLYSDLFRAIIQISTSDTYSLDQLAGNIRVLHEHVQGLDEETDDFKKNVTKLYDHLNLDISRIRYTEQITENLNTKLHENDNNIKKSLISLADKAQTVQKDNITILGIFSSIVITFVAGMVFSGSVLNNIDKVSIYRLTFVIIVLALMLFNLLQLLFSFLQKVHFHGMEISDIGKMSVIAGVNVMLFIAMIIDLLLWIIYWYRATGFDTFTGY